MKVAPSQQSLILASEYLAPSATSSAVLNAALGLTASGAVLNRVTVVAARPDATLILLRADYSPRTGLTNDSPAVGEVDPEPPRHDGGTNPVPTSISAQRSLTQPRNSLRLASGSFARSRGGSSVFSPADLYARTQDSLGDMPKGIHVDVRA
ncbi:MAG: hypothetical protein ACLP2F_04345 [Steroidobacteraceae bacterium]